MNLKDTELAERLRLAGLRPTRQRLSLAAILFGAGDRHVSAESLHQEALAARIGVSLATVYNTLNQFKAAGLLRETAPSSIPTPRIISTTTSKKPTPLSTSAPRTLKFLACRRCPPAPRSTEWTSSSACASAPAEA